MCSHLLSSIRLSFRMSIQARHPQGWLISHEAYLNELYGPLGLKSKSYFDLRTPYRMDLEACKVAHSVQTGCAIEKKRKRRKELPSAETALSNDLLAAFLTELKARSPGDFQTEPSPTIIADNNREMRELTQGAPDFKLDNLSAAEQSRYRNASTTPIIHELSEHQFLVPSEGEYYLGDVSRLDTLLGARLSRGGSKWQVILLDPPWENKHVKRTRGYPTMDNGAMMRNLPIQDLLDEDGYVIIWCTVNERHIRDLQGWLEHWECDLLGQWYWLKVTQSGEPVVSFDKGHKKPYEWLFFARKRPVLANNLERSPCPEALQERRVICSVPSAFHSHKPPLVEILRDIFPQMGAWSCLEIFGRYLLPNWTTIGNECLKFQAIGHYTASLS